MLAAQPGTRLHHAFERLQKARSGSSNTISTGDRRAYHDWLRADETVIDWVASGEPLTIEHIKKLNEYVSASSKGNANAQSPFMPLPWMLMLSPTSSSTSIWQFRQKQVTAWSLNRSNTSRELHQHQFIDYRDIPKAMNDFIEWYQLNEKNLHPVTLAALSYRWLVSIHPFADGNGRTARLVMDWILQKNGYPPATLVSGYVSVASFGRFSQTEEANWQGQERAVYSVSLGLAKTFDILRDVHSQGSTD
jgi:prophage maintenance system killer protein